MTSPFNSLSGAIEAVCLLQEACAAPPTEMDVAWTLHHCAQSIEYSLDGFPRLKPWWFRATVGRAAFGVFSAKGRMQHDLHAAIPGAADIAAAQPLEPAIERLAWALERFARHDGRLSVHFAYGVLDKAAYTRAHLMHLANHWEGLGLPQPRRSQA